MSKIKLINEDFFNPSPKNAKFLQKLVGQIDLILTDLPYNIGHRGKVTKSHGKLWSNAETWNDHFKDNFTQEEYDEFVTNFLKRSFLLLKPGGSLVTFIDDKYAGVLIRIAESIKPPTGFAHKKNIHFVKINCVPKLRAWNYASACEVAVWLVKPKLKGSSKTKPNIFNYEKPGKARVLYDEEGNKVGIDIKQYHGKRWSNIYPYVIGKKRTHHVTEKYDSMLRPLIETHSNEGSIVLDPFFGGGNSALICNELKRHYIGFEINPKWHAVACNLLKEQLSK
jgi:site-specific DNA-methyltransferase (adenine-specific)